MNNILNLTLFFAVVTLFSCGNDEKVEEQYVNKVNQAIEILDKATTVEEISDAQDTLNVASLIKGYEELQDRGRVKDVRDKFNQALDSAQQRILDQLLK